MMQIPDGQDQCELFDVMPTPARDGLQTDTSSLSLLMSANVDGRFPTVARRDAHAKGVWHRSIGVWLYTADGKVVLQKRSMLKDTNAGRWQMSVGGHVSSGQSVEESVLVEVQEELGLALKAEDLEFVGLFTKSEVGETARFGKYTDNEYTFLYIAQIEERPLNLDPLEVTETHYRDMYQVFARFREHDPDYCHSTEEYADMALAAIEKSLGIT